MVAIDTGEMALGGRYGDGGSSGICVGDADKDTGSEPRRAEDTFSVTLSTKASMRLTLPFIGERVRPWSS
jgi:hypothetical protein